MLTQREIENKIGGYPQMSGAKIAAMAKKEFPWLRKCIKIRNIRRLFVSGVELELLKYTTNCYRDDIYDFEEIVVFVDDRGNILPQSKSLWRRILEVWNWFDRFPFSKIAKKTTIEAALRRLGDNLPKVRFIYSHFNGTGTVIVYKVSNKVSVVDLMT